MEHERGISRSAGNFNATTRRKQTSLSVNGPMQYPRFHKIVTPCMVQNAPNCKMDAVPNCKMVLPSAFVRTYLANVEDPQAMVLESFASSWEWQVTFTNESFKDGWQVFSTDYNLGSGDVITFQLKDKFQFMVQVYSKSGCEKFSCFDVGASNMWTFLRHRATAASEGVAHPEPESTEMMPKKFPLRNMNDRYMAEGLSESRSRSGSACKSGESQDCMDNRESPSQTLNIGGKVDDKFMAATIEKHRERRRINSTLQVTTKSGVTTGTDFGRSSNDIDHRYAIRSSLRFKRDNHHVKGKQAPHFMQRQTSTSQMLAKGFIERAKRTMNLRVRMKPKVSWFEYKRRLLKFANFVLRITPESTDERAEQSADNVIRTSRESAGEAQGSCNKNFIEQVKATRNSRVSEEKRSLSTSSYAVNPCGGGTSKRPECDMSVDMKPDVTKIDVTKWRSINDTTRNCSKTQPQGTPAKRGRGRPRKCPVHPQPAIKPEVLTPGFRRVDREATPVEEVEREETPIEGVEKPAQRRRGRPPIYHNSECRQAGTISSLRQDRIVFVSQRRLVTESEKDDAVAAAYSAAARMQSPCIVLVLKPSSVYKNFALRFPSKFASQRMPRQTRVVRVCDSKWDAWSCWWNPSYHHISGREWRSFALEHCLEEDDACVFEILEHSRKNFTMMVHIFRVADIPAGQTAWDSHICPYNCFPEDSSCPITPIERQSFVDSELGPPPESPRKFTRSTHQDDDNDDDDDDDDEADDDYDDEADDDEADDDYDDESRDVNNVDSVMTEATHKNPVQEKQTKGRPSNFGFKSLDDIISGTKTAGLSDQQLRNPKKGIASEKDFYTVGRLCNRKKVRNSNVFLVELDGVVPPMPHMKSKDCKPDGNGNWWVHERNFTRDFRYCHIP